MPKVAIPDTSCLIALSSLGKLEILKQFYATVLVPSAVQNEFGDGLPAWIKVKDVSDHLSTSVLRNSLGPGEAEVIVLASEENESLVILDDQKARRIAIDLNIRCTGTIGLLLRAKNEGLVNSLADVLGPLAESGFRISAELTEQMLKLAGER